MKPRNGYQREHADKTLAARLGWYERFYAECLRLYPAETAAISERVSKDGARMNGPRQGRPKGAKNKHPWNPCFGAHPVRKVLCHRKKGHDGAHCASGPGFSVKWTDEVWAAVPTDTEAAA